MMWLILMLFCPVTSIPYPKERCSMADCSGQLLPFQNRSCVIHNPIVGKYSMSNFTQSPEVRLKEEEDAKFSIAVTPYVAEIYARPITFALTAINITLKIRGMGINALAVKITKENSTICRIFDFQSLEENSTSHVDFYYDCFYDLHKYSNAQMDVIALPMNNLLSYYIYIPPSQTSKPISSCFWKPVIMVFSGQLFDGIVIVKFSQAPQQFNISFYSVELINNSSKPLSLTVPAQEVDMLSVKFSSVSFGYYSTIVKPLGKGCIGTQFGVFQVGNSKPGLDTLTVICMCIVLLSPCCFLVFYKIVARFMKLELSKKQALLVFSHDFQEHIEFVTALINYFSKECHLEVSTIYNEQNPLSHGQSAVKWREDRFDEADVIIFLISEGLLFTLNEDDKNLKQVKVFHPWKTQLRDTYNYMRCLTNSKDRKRICKVRFPYLSRLKIPKPLDRNTGICFKLPKQMNKFLQFVHDIHPAIPWVQPSLCPNLNSSKSGKILLQSIEAVQAKVNNNLHVEYEPARNQETDMQGSRVTDEEHTNPLNEKEEIDSLVSYMNDEDYEHRNISNERREIISLISHTTDEEYELDHWNPSNEREETDSLVSHMTDKENQFLEENEERFNKMSLYESDDDSKGESLLNHNSSDSFSVSNESFSEDDEGAKKCLQDIWKVPNYPDHE